MTNKPHNVLEGERPTLSIDLSHETSDEKVSVIIVHNGRPGYLNILLQSLTIISANNNFEIIVVDNGSEDKITQDYLDQIEKDGVKVIRNKSNLFWGVAANQGARLASKDSKYLVFMHHDLCILNPAWLDLLITSAESKKSGMVGLKLKYYDMAGQRLGFIDESCLLVSRECWDVCSPFNEEVPQEGASFLMTILANRKGFNPQAIDQTKTPLVYHYNIFALNYNEYERITENARKMLPKFVNEIQNS